MLPGGPRRVSGVMVPQTRVRTDAADELRAPGEDVRGVNDDHSRTDAERHRALSGPPRVAAEGLLCSFEALAGLCAASGARGTLCRAQHFQT